MARVQRTPLLTAEVGAEVTRRYIAGETAQGIADDLGINQTKVLRELHRLGVKVRDRREAATRHMLRHDAFDVLSPDAAYWCGFLFADGSIAQRPNGAPQVAVGLSECDRGHLERLRMFLGSSHAISAVRSRENTHRTGVYKSRAACRFTVTSAHLAERLLALGRYDGPIDDGLARSRDFWRGVIDGDGSVGVSCGLPYLRVVGSQRLLEAFVRFLGRVGTRRLHVRPHKSIFCVSTSGATAERVIDRLYGGATTALGRKATKAADILAQVSVPQSKPRLGPGPRVPQGGARRALINAKNTMCAYCVGDVVVADGRVRINHATDCRVADWHTARVMTQLLAAIQSADAAVDALETPAPPAA